VKLVRILSLLLLAADSFSTFSWRVWPTWLDLRWCEWDLKRFSQWLTSLVSLQAFYWN